VDPARLITLPRGMIGFPLQRRYILLDHAPGSPFHWLQSVDEPGLAFPVASPLHFIADYRPDFPSELSEVVGEYAPEDLWLGVVVSFPPGEGRATLNLKAPLVLNTRSRLGVQLVLDDPALPLRYALPAGA
jgi:flagellar assembly factor FliW